MLIENLTTSDESPEGNMLIRLIGHDVSALQIIEEIGDKKLGSVLDICHALGSINIKKVVNPFLDISIKDYIEAFSPSIGLVHLSNGRELARGENHGVLFETEEEIALLAYILNCMMDNKYEVPLTLELADMSGYEKTRDLIIGFLDKQGVKYIY